MRLRRVSWGTLLVLLLVFGSQGCDLLRYHNATKNNQPVQVAIEFAECMQRQSYIEAQGLCQSLSAEQLKEYGEAIPFTAIYPREEIKRSYYIPEWWRAGNPRSGSTDSAVLFEGPQSGNRQQTVSVTLRLAGSRWYVIGTEETTVSIAPG